MKSFILSNEYKVIITICMSFISSLCAIISSVSCWQWLQSGLKIIKSNGLFSLRSAFVNMVTLSLRRICIGGREGNLLYGAVVVSAWAFATMPEPSINMNRIYFITVFKNTRLSQIV